MVAAPADLQEGSKGPDGSRRGAPVQYRAGEIPKDCRCLTTLFPVPNVTGPPKLAGFDTTAYPAFSPPGSSADPGDLQVSAGVRGSRLASAASAGGAGSGGAAGVGTGSRASNILIGHPGFGFGRFAGFYTRLPAWLGGHRRTRVGRHRAGRRWVRGPREAACGGVASMRAPGLRGGGFRLFNGKHRNLQGTYWQLPFRVGIRPILVNATSGKVFAGLCSRQ